MPIFFFYPFYSLLQGNILQQSIPPSSSSPSLCGEWPSNARLINHSCRIPITPSPLPLPPPFLLSSFHSPLYCSGDQITTTQRIPFSPTEKIKSSSVRFIFWQHYPTPWITSKDASYTECGRQDCRSYDTNKYVKAQTGHSHARQLDSREEREK